MFFFFFNYNCRQLLCTYSEFLSKRFAIKLPFDFSHRDNRCSFIKDAKLFEWPLKIDSERKTPNRAFEQDEMKKVATRENRSYVMSDYYDYEKYDSSYYIINKNKNTFK